MADKKSTDRKTVARSNSPSSIPLKSVDAGDFATWLKGTHASQLEGKDSDVPCGDCNGCCKSFYFIHITPKDSAALEVIPRELLVDAPGLPAGHFVMGYDEHGHCPMLKNDKCSIYSHRPQTCRAYDCRIFAASDMQPGESDKALVSERTALWNFNYKTPADKTQQTQVARAARWLVAERDNAQSHLPDNFIPSNSTQLAVLAIELHKLFGDEPGTGQYASKAHAEACITLKS